jgi:TRAP-type mannitol/chloroaromatic compound transport system permease small subunit
VFVEGGVRGRILGFFGQMLSFVGKVCSYFVETFRYSTAPIFSKAANGPVSNFFEFLISVFLFSCVLVVLLGVLQSLRRRNVSPLIATVERYNRFFAVAGAWALSLLVAAMVFEVVSRYFLGAPTKWAYEVSYMLMGTSFMLGIAYCMQMRRHVRVDFFYDRAGPKTKSVIDIVGYCVLIPMVLWLCAGLWDYFYQAYRVNELSGESAWNPIIWPFKFTFVIGFVLLLMQTVVELLKSILVLLAKTIPGGYGSGIEVAKK